jgi:hypothetical protein
LHISLPGLLEAAILPDLNPQEFPALCTLLSRATVQVNREICLENVLKSYFQGLPKGNIPSGAIEAKLWGLEPKAGEYWCKADPISPVLDHKTAYLQDNSQLHLTDQEINQLGETLKAFFAEDQLDLHLQNSQHWYCKMNGHTQVAMNDMWELWGKSMAMLLPSGPDENYWRRFLTECQMLLMQHPVNQQRQAKGQPIISSLWFWGVGTLPESLKTTFKKVYSDEALVRGLAHLADCEHAVMPKQLSLNESNSLYFDSSFMRYAKLQAAEEAYVLLGQYERDYFQPLLTALKQKQLATLVIETQTCRFEIKPRHLHYFWRNVKSLQHIYNKNHE